jgi:hypothetical protein
MQPHYSGFRFKPTRSIKDINNKEFNEDFLGRRKGPILNKKFQIKFIFYIFSFNLVAMTLIHFAATFWNLSVYSKSALLLFLLTSGGVWLSQKVAGPIYKIYTTIEDSVQNRIEGPIKFRKNDFFPEFESIMNQQIAYILELQKINEENDELVKNKSHENQMNFDESKKAS